MGSIHNHAGRFAPKIIFIKWFRVEKTVLLEKIV